MVTAIAKVRAGRAKVALESPSPHDEAGDGQDGGQEARHQQGRELHEHEGRQTVADDDLDEAQRLREPDERHQPGGDQHQGKGELAQHITVQAVKERQGWHLGCISGRVRA
jgi:hypothetical protein